MRIGNDYVQVKIGNKTYTKKNMILDTMLNNVFINQLSPSIYNEVAINYCGIKFDTPLENLDYDSQPQKEDFDIYLFKPQRFIEIDEKNFKKNSVCTNDNIKINYNFSNDGLFLYNDIPYEAEKLQMFEGKKITAIGFASSDYTFLAVADVSKLNIILNTNEQLEIYRTDTYQSDAKCVGFDYPLHLVNGNAYYYAENYSKQGESNTPYKVAQLYSIGLGNKEGLMETEHIINIEEEIYGNNYITIDFSEQIKIGHYPSENLFPGFYPTMDNSKYLVLKYRLCKIDALNNLTPLDEYYTMSYKYDLSQYEGQTKNITFTLSIERM